MNWLKPLEGGTWWGEDAGARKPPRPNWRTQPDEQQKLEARKAEARRLAKSYTRTKVAKLMGVDQSTVTKWLGCKHRANIPYSKR
jgi:hypothetical protein